MYVAWHQEMFVALHLELWVAWNQELFQDALPLPRANIFIVSLMLRSSDNGPCKNNFL